MKKSILIFWLLLNLFIFPQSLIQKISPNLQTKLRSSTESDKFLIWIYFTDKGDFLNKYFTNPELVVSKKSLQRRAKLNLESLIDFTDLPVNQTYIESLIENGFQLKQKSRWLNAVSGYANKISIQKIIKSNFVKFVDEVKRIKKSDDNLEFTETFENTDSFTPQPEGVYSLNYGASFTQLNQIQVPAVHNLGYNGSGVTICVMDAGFNNLGHRVFDSMQIIARWDFVNGDANVGDHGDMGNGTHGTQTLSVIGGFAPGNLIGPAYRSKFILAKTENTDSETPVEEDNWVAAVEWADSIGVDITSTSLGYLEYDFPFPSYTWQNMDGNTAIITIAGDLAVKKGIVVVNSAGNEGLRTTPNSLMAPADGDSILAIGAVNSSGNRVSFSSFGPTVDGRIKPDFMAMGSSVYAARASSPTQYSYVSGTSFSCPLAAGAIALLLQANPNLTPIQIRNILRETSTRSNNPNNLNGWGIIQTQNALNRIITSVNLISFNAVYTNNAVNLNWTISNEFNYYGFEIQKKYHGGQFQTIAFINKQNNSASRVNYFYTDKDIKLSKIYYRLKIIDLNGNENYSQEVTVNLHSDDDFILYQNYPNPFNSQTIFSWHSSVDSHTSLLIYDVLGNEVITLVNEYKTAGIHKINFDASTISNNFSSGIYFLKLKTDSYQKQIKFVYIK